ncbi:hypothetical protein ACFQU2_15310 [Siccirubricoccus deserti]
MTLEDSVYIGTEPRKTSQIVLQAEPREDTIQWAISRVGAAGEGRPHPRLPL